MKYISYTRDSYKSGDAWYICDRCSQRHRRSGMLTEWTGLKVDGKCIDPRPPQMFPADVYPEGIPFVDARPPQDNADRWTDTTYLSPGQGGIGATNGQIIASLGAGALSPRPILQTPVPLGPNVLTDDITIRTGPIFPPSVPIPPFGG